MFSEENENWFVARRDREADAKAEAEAKAKAAVVQPAAVTWRRCEFVPVGVEIEVLDSLLKSKKEKGMMRSRDRREMRTPIRPFSAFTSGCPFRVRI